MTTVYPAQIRSSADERATSRFRSRGVVRWGLDIAGPFSPFPHRSKASDLNSRAVNICDQVSALFGMPVRFIIRNDDSLDIYVILTDAEKERIFRKEYARVTEAN